MAGGWTRESEGSLEERERRNLHLATPGDRLKVGNGQYATLSREGWFRGKGERQRGGYPVRFKDAVVGNIHVQLDFDLDGGKVKGVTFQHCICYFSSCY